MTSKRRIAIIGAGISGLAQADVFTRCGFEVVLFERSPRVGGVWARAYPEVSLQNSAPQYHLSRYPWPFKPDLHPTGAQILRYLEAAAAALRLDVRLGHEVVSARPSGEGGGWDLEVRGPDGSVARHHCDHLVASIGQYSEGKHRPALPGEETWAGQVVTERDVTDLALFHGRRVAVVGFGKSALDMACFAATQKAAEVHHLFRTPRWTLPRHFFGVHMTHLLFNRFGSVMMTCWAHPTALERGLHKLRPLVAGFWSGLQRLVRTVSLRQAGSAGKEGRQRIEAVLPRHPLLPDLRSAAALAPDDYYRRIANQEIRPHHAEVSALVPEGLRLSNGETLPCDLLVLSVGSRPPVFPFFEAPLRQLLEGEPDGVQLYRHLIHPGIPNLGFAGYNHGFMHVPSAEVGALWLAALWRGELALPPAGEMEGAMAHVRDWKRAHIHFEPSRSCAINTRFQQYLDIVLGDLGVSPYRKLPNVLAELFARYGAADYTGVVDEYLAHLPAVPRRPSPLPT